MSPTFVVPIKLLKPPTVKLFICAEEFAIKLFEYVLPVTLIVLVFTDVLDWIEFVNILYCIVVLPPIYTLLETYNPVPGP